MLDISHSFFLSGGLLRYIEGNSCNYTKPLISTDNQRFIEVGWSQCELVAIISFLSKVPTEFKRPCESTVISLSIKPNGRTDRRTDERIGRTDTQTDWIDRTDRWTYWTKGWFSVSRACVKFTLANKIEAMHERSLNFSFKLNTILFTWLKFTRVNVRSQKCVSGNQP